MLTRKNIDDARHLDHLSIAARYQTSRGYLGAVFVSRLTSTITAIALAYSPAAEKALTAVSPWFQG